ncbi:MAG: phosphoribosyltransferase [Thermoprotei archaeon]|mgnify:CR=1 FL=1|jgi:hypoxanthine phosphoribosyltransferase
MSNDEELKLLAPTWDELFFDTVKLSEKILMQNYQADAIVAIARGGWIVGRLLSDLLEQPNLINLRIEFYDSIGRTKSDPKIVQPIATNIKGLRVLIVDDVVDTGITLLKAVQHVIELGASEVKTATIYYKPWARIKPDFYVKITTSWILFPHEIKESIKILYNRWHKKGLSTDEMIDILVRAGMKKRIAKYFVNVVKSEFDDINNDVKIKNFRKL